MFKHSLLIIDDDKIFCDTVKDAFDPARFEVMTTHTKKSGLAACLEKKMDVVVLDQKLPDGEGHSICPDILDCNENTKIIFVTAYPSFQNAVNAIKAGAYDYLSKPFSLEELRMTVHRSLDMQKLERVKDLETYRIGKERDNNVLVGDFESNTYLRELINMAATANSPVLITGETGTGKNVVARAIHFTDSRRDNQSPLIKVNCAALPENLIEDELFGHEKGAFTDAGTSRKGIFELADGGTLVMDEIGDMPLHLQAKLLGVLDDQKIRRLGGQSSIPVNVRVIASTNREPEEAVENKTFRRDLYYRLSVIRIHVPPLRERTKDIPPLCEYFIEKMGGTRSVKLPKEELNRLMEYHWPGNIRELKNIIERSLLLHGDTLYPSRLIGASSVRPGPASAVTPVKPGELKTLEQVEKEHILRVLGALSYNITQSANALGVSRSTLKRKVKELGIEKK